MKFIARNEWIIPTVFIVLTLLPIIGGMERLISMAADAEITTDNVRYLADPIPAIIHIVSFCIFCVLGAFQFMPGFRRRRPTWHRYCGRILVVNGLAAALSGLYLNQFYPPIEHDSFALYIIRVIVGIAMFLFICFGLLAIIQRRYKNHQNWMVRAYALGMGNGLVPFLAVVTILFQPDNKELAKVLVLAGGWVINMIIAEWIIYALNKKPLATANITKLSIQAA